MTAISILIALGAGIVSFASPCCLPLVPVYVSYMVGTDPDGTGRGRRVALRQSLVFVLGFSVVFVALWASVGLVGYALRDYAGILRQVGGVALILMGLHVAGLIRISALYRDIRLPVGRLLGPPAVPAAARVATPPVDSLSPSDTAGAATAPAATLSPAAASTTVDAPGGHGATAGPSYGRSALLGVAFAAGWTPCIGPILGGILMLASQSDTVAAGTAQLVAYAAGLGIPFVLVAVGATEVRDRFGWFRRHHAAVSMATGAMLALLGFLMITNLFTRLSGTLPSFGI